MQKISQFPVPERLNMIRFAQIDRHLNFILASEIAIKRVTSFASEDKYLLEDAPQISWGFIKGLKKISATIKHYIKLSESNLTSALDGVLMMEELGCFLISELDQLDLSDAQN